MPLPEMQQDAIRPILDDFQVGSGSTVSTLEAVSREARIPEAPKRSGKGEGTKGSDEKVAQGKYYTFWHYELGYREKWFASEERAKKWLTYYGFGWKMD